MIDVPGSTTPIRAVVAIPESGRGPCVVICHDAKGLDPFIRDAVSLYAEEGYVAIAPELGESAGARSRLDSAIRFARSRPECDKPIGLLGFGSGADLALEAAARLEVDAVVAYMPAAIERLIGEAPGIRCPLALHFAGADPSVPEAAISRLRSALHGNPAAEVHVYSGTAHDFVRPELAAHNRTLALLAHDRSIGVFRRSMGPRYDLGALWEAHRNHEFFDRDTAKTMATMVASPYVNHIPTMTGGVGFEQLARFYKYHFIPKNSTDRSAVLVSRIIGATQVVEEFLTRFLHDRESDWMLPGIEPTGRRIEIPLVVIVKFRGPRIYHEHIYWDQASVLAQIGLLDAKGLPVTGVEQARKLLDETLPSNTLMRNWAESEGKPIP